jgi:phosphatidylglycerol---prolipoprotein diacylglyceryl transferase
MILSWNPNPELIRIGGFGLRYYSLLFVAGIALGLFIMNRIWKKEGRDAKELDILATYVILGVIAGARLGHCLFYDFSYYIQHPLQMILPISITDSGIQFTGFQGLSSHGGAIGIIIALAIHRLRHHSAILAILDRIAVAAPLTGAMIRLGNFMNSEIIGRPTDGTWGIIFKAVDDIPRHPGQLYESLAYLIIFGVMFLVQRKGVLRFQGRSLGLLLILVFTARFFIEFSKEYQSAFERFLPLDMGQLLSIPFVLAGIVLLIRSGKVITESSVSGR